MQGVTTLFFEGVDFTGIALILLGIMCIPSLIFLVIGLVVQKTNKKSAKILFIIAVVLLMISLGICGTAVL